MLCNTSPDIQHKKYSIRKSVTYPTIVPTPTSLSTVTPAIEVNSSGADDPAAINVAPATSSDKSSFSLMTSSEGTKKSSQTIARAVQKKWKVAIFRYLCD